MRTTVIITDPSNSGNLSRSLVSLLESSSKPTNVCMVFGSNVTDNQWATAKAIMSGCCGSEPPQEQILADATVVKNNKYEINFYAIKINKLFEHELKNYAINLLKSNTDIFFTLSSGSAYDKDLIDKFLNQFKTPIINAVYSDYFEGPKEKFLQSFNSMMTGNIPVKDVAFRNNGLLFKTDNFTLLTEVYSNGIIKHIPEFLLST